MTDIKDKDAQYGTPTMVLLPAKRYKFRVLKKEHKIILPRKGWYNKLDKDYFSEKDGEFMLLDDKNSVMYLPAISKVLFAIGKYPDLEPNQLFAPIALIFKKSKVEIIGQVVEML